MPTNDITKNNREIELLIEQRNHLIMDIQSTNVRFNQTIFVTISAIISIVAAKIFSLDYKQLEIITLILVQLIILCAIYITIQLISGNLQRYYICAIDDYLYEEYEITCLFYQGNLSQKHTIGKLKYKYIFPWMTSLGALISILVLLWFGYYLQIYTYIFTNQYFILLTIIELLLLVTLIATNAHSKEHKSKEYLECLEYLRREKKEDTVPKTNISRKS